MTSQASSVTLEDALALYEREFLASRNLAPLTRQAYLADLEELCAFLRDRAGIADVAHVRREHLEGFLSELDHRGLSGNYRRRRSLRSAPSSAFWRSEDWFSKAPPASSSPRSANTTSPAT